MEHKVGSIPSFIHTASGLFIDPLDLKPENVRVADIAHHLGNQCRWSGAPYEFYSVGQHSVLSSLLVPEEDAMEALFHDSAEYVLQDLVRPLKVDPSFGKAYRIMEKQVERLIADKLGLTYPWPAVIKEVDQRLLVTEARDLVHGTSKWGYYDDVVPYDFTIVPWTPPRARREFMKRYKKLGGTE